MSDAEDRIWSTIMGRAMIATGAEAALRSLEEDFETSWAPDPLFGVDFPALAQAPLQQRSPMSRFSFPRPRTHPLPVYSLPFDLHLELHRSVDPFRSLADSVLMPGVCGYRRGAEPNNSYRIEHGRYMDFVRSGLDSYPFVVVADAAEFFQEIDTSALIKDLTLLFDPTATERVGATLNRFRQLGITGLPPGYADARLLANLYLAPVDEDIPAPFARWVDDYRIFVDSAAQADAALAGLANSLRGLGLALNVEKTQVLGSGDARARLLGRSLESVYHPDTETGTQTVRSLRALFSSAISEPVEHRRELRFALRRLGVVRDPIAVEFTLAAIHDMEWELPRLVSYISHFLNREDVATRVQDAFVRALASHNDWASIRLAPPVARLALDTETLDAVEEALSTPSIPALSGLLIRILGRHGRHSFLTELAHSAPDPRALVAALVDSGLDPPDVLLDAVPVSWSVLQSAPAPLPTCDSIL